MPRPAPLPYLTFLFVLMVSTAAMAGLWVKRAAYLHQFGKETPFHRQLFVRVPGKWTMSGREIPVPFQQRTTHRIDLPLEDVVYRVHEPLRYEAQQLTVYTDIDVANDLSQHQLQRLSGQIKLYVDSPRARAVIELKDAQGNSLPWNGEYPLIRGYPPICEGCL